MKIKNCSPKLGEEFREGNRNNKKKIRLVSECRLPEYEQLSLQRELLIV